MHLDAENINKTENLHCGKIFFSFFRRMLIVNILSYRYVFNCVHCAMFHYFLRR